jgi:type IV pilus assembly protein PilW
MKMRSRGFSVVELMVAMTLSLIMLSGILAVLYSSRVTYAENERVARLQEGGRAALELVLRDLRAAGFRGCAQSVPFRNVLNNSADLLWRFDTPVQGFEATGATWSPALVAAVTPSAEPGSDVVAVRTIRAGMPSMMINTGMAAATSNIDVDKDAADNFAVGQTVLVSDCTGSAVFAVDGFLPVGATATVYRDSGGSPAVAGVGPGNATDDLGLPFQVGAQVAPVDTVIYYIRASGVGTGPALWRVVGAGAAQELIPGVEAMQVTYGRDTNGDRLVDDYVAADAIGDWRQVISVSVAMLIRSAEANSLDTDTRTYDLLGAAVGPFNDRFQRAVYASTVTLRNQTD